MDSREDRLTIAEGLALRGNESGTPGDPRVAVLVPCFNEEAAVAKVVADFAVRRELIRSGVTSAAAATGAGATALIVIPSAPISSATARIIPSMAAFAAP